jgi:hypothetical protein
MCCSLVSSLNDIGSGTEDFGYQIGLHLLTFFIEKMFHFAVLQCVGEPQWNFALHCCHVFDVLGDGTHHFCSDCHTLSLRLLSKARYVSQYMNETNSGILGFSPQYHGYCFLIF